MIALARTAPAPRRANVRALRPRLEHLMRYYVDRAGGDQTAIAKEAGIHHSTVSRLISGTRNPSREMILKLAGPLDLAPRERDELLVLAGYVPRTLAEDLRRIIALPDPDRALLRTLLDRLGD